jgi:hypothetical protein
MLGNLDAAAVEEQMRSSGELELHRDLLRSDRLSPALAIKASVSS